MRELSETERFLHEERLASVNARYHKMLDVQAQYGRWLVTTLVILHAGGMAAISQSDKLAIPVLGAAGEFLIWGVITALLSGLFAWFNWGVLAGQMVKYTVSDIYLDTSKWPEADPAEEAKIAFTYWAAVGAGLLSAALLLAAFYSAADAVRKVT